MGSAGQPAESDFDSGTDADASSDDEATALDCSDMPTYLTESSKLNGYFWAIRNTSVVGRGS